MLYTILYYTILYYTILHYTIPLALLLVSLSLSLLLRSVLRTGAPKASRQRAVFAPHIQGAADVQLLSLHLEDVGNPVSEMSFWITRANAENIHGRTDP